MAGLSSRLKEFEGEINAMANAQFDTPAYHRLYAVRFTPETARIYILQRAHFVLNRRSCWAHAAGQSPFDVKGQIWSHERDELKGDPDRDLENHYVLGVMEGAAVGLTPEDFAAEPILPGVEVACCAWLHLARDKPWPAALAASNILEIANSDEIVEGGSNSRRIGEKMAEELGIALEEQPSNAEHVVAEIEHAHLLMEAARAHGETEGVLAQMLDGARISLAVDRVYKNAMAEAMEAVAAALAA